jgi:acetyltransferase-like isoleucine patch superfamily enzyme
MRKNYTQIGTIGNDNRIHIDGDWYSRGIPSNVNIADSVYIDTSYGFAGFHSTQAEALIIDEASGCYDRSSIITSERGMINIGKFVILNGTTLICKKQITIGDHCMLAWGSVLTDSWLNAGSFSIAARKTLLKKAATDPLRRYPFAGNAASIVLEDNCWVGFDSVILPGVRLGRGCVVGCKSVVHEDVPPYAVVTGSPARTVRYLQPNDTNEAKQMALRTHIH